MKYWICVVMVACAMTGCNLLKSSAQSEDAQEENAQAVLAETPVDKDNIDNEKVDKLNNNQSDGENDNIDGVNGEKLDVSVKGEDKSPFFETRVSWPEFDIAHADKAVYAIESGSNSEGAWFEGKGHCCPTKMWRYSWFGTDFLLKGNSAKPPFARSSEPWRSITQFFTH
ncbi:MAG: hypothetical protein IJ165_07585 [Proteobacteria bacterium]|nr:hypothetical protein [Pseudomonadota bacterium]